MSLKWKLETSRQKKGIDYVTETNTYRAFLPFNTPIRKIGFFLERASNPTSNQGDVGLSPAQGKNQFLGLMCVLKGKNAR